MSSGMPMADASQKKRNAIKEGRDGFYYLWVPEMNKSVRMNDKARDTYLSMPDGMHPYQSLDMHKLGNVRYAPVVAIDKYDLHRTKFEQIMDSIEPNRNYDLVSDIDIYKMKRDDPDIDAKYLALQDPQLTEHLKRFSKLKLKSDISKIGDFIFVPYIPSEQNIISTDELTPHNIYTKINIVNNSGFMAYLKNLIKDDMQRGRLIYEFNKMFYFYHNMLDTMTKYIQREVTPLNIIDTVIQLEKIRVYGINKQTIKNRIVDRNTELAKYKKYVKSSTCIADYDAYFSDLAQLNGIAEIPDYIQRIRNCNASSLNLDSMIYKDLDNKQMTDDTAYNFCKTMKFAPTDTFEGKTYQAKCRAFAEKIKNDDVRAVLLKDELFTNFKKDRCLNLSDHSIEEFDLLEKFMPEWHEAVSNGDLQTAFNHRQMLVGDTNVTTFFRNCTLFYRSDPFISKECDLPGLVHDIELNKIIVSCVAGREDVFPIRIVDGKYVENIKMYEPFKFKDGDILLGSLSIKLKGKRTDYKDRYYNNYLYYNPNERFKLRPINFRSNVIIPGTIIEHVRVLYLEMNTLLYYEDDMKTKLYFYKFYNKDRSNFDVFVSKYDKAQIQKKYESFKSIENPDLEGLIPVTLEKDTDKKFKFREIASGAQIGGGSESESGSESGSEQEGTDYRFDFKCDDIKDYKWDIKSNDEPLVFDKDVFSISLYLEQLKLIDKFMKMAGSEVYDTKCTPIHYVKGVTTPTMARMKQEDVKEIWKEKGIEKKDTSGKMYDATLSLIKENQTILAYNFESTLGIRIYRHLNSYLKPAYGSKYLIFSKNHYVLDGLLLYAKSVILKDISQDIAFYLYGYKYEPFSKVTNYLDTNKVRYMMISEPMNDRWLDNQKIEKIDLSIIDIVIGIDDLLSIRYAYLFQSQLPPIVLSLKNLSVGGSMILNTCLIPNKMVFNFISFVSCFFEQSFVSEFAESELHATGQIVFSFIIFKKFKGCDQQNINKMLELNRIMYEFDETGGYGFDVKDPYIRRMFELDREDVVRNKKEKDIDKDKDTDDDYVEADKPNADKPNADKPKPKPNTADTKVKRATKYVTSIIGIDSSRIAEQYKAYKEYTKMMCLGSIRNFSNRLSIFMNKHNKEYTDMTCSNAKAMAIFLARKYDMPLLDWAQAVPTEYFDKMIETRFKNIGYTSLYDLERIDKIQLKLIESTKLSCEYCAELDKNLLISELAYLYIEKINYDKYKGVELFINNKYKDMNRLLQQERGINIMGSYVSRAWIKFYELLSDTNLLKSHANKKELNVFHICEAPGNFIMSATKYIELNTKIGQYNWKAQSLSELLADIHDAYGFMKHTEDRWDMGPKDTGDIMDPSNVEYYLNKYKNNNFVIGDCGEKWSPGTPDNKNLTIYQMFYALLIPNKGGGFVIKSYSSNYNKMYLCLLYIACYVFESVQIFKSNMNFWSPEVYVVGKNKRELTTDEISVLMSSLHSLDSLEKDPSGQSTKYPIADLPTSFVKTYESIVYELITYASDIKKFFVFLSTNDQIFSTNKSNIASIIQDKNKGWIDKYMPKK